MAKKKSQKHVQQNLGLTGQPGPRRAYKPFVPGPNPDLPEFIKRHSTPYDPATDKYDVPAFDRDIVSNKTSPLYALHTYWSKKDPVPIGEYVRHYTQPGALVGDPFSGSGTTGVACSLNGRHAVLIDASPSAALLSYIHCLDLQESDVQSAYESIVEAVGSDVDALYETRCDRCGGPAITEYVVYSERFQCPRCAEIVALSDCPEVKVPYRVGGKKSQKIEPKKRRVCPHCLKAQREPEASFAISTRTKRFGPVPVLVSYECLGTCKPKRGERRHDEPHNTRKRRHFQECDLSKLAAIEKATVPHWYPNRKMMDVQDDKKPWGVKWRAGTSNFRSVGELYTKRNLWALAAIRSSTGWPQVTDLRTLFFTGLLHKCSHLMACNADGVGRVTKGTYYVPQLRMECRPTKYMREALSDLRRHYAARLSVSTHAGECIVAADDAARGIGSLPRNTLDYIFTDPPYVGKVQYGELNFVWESWLGLEGTWLKDEIIVNPFRNKSLDDWDHGIRQALGACFAVLKPGRWLSLCYHDTDPETWARIQNALLDTGFEIHTVTVLDPKQKSSNQLLAEKVVKSDLVLNCRKPREGEGREARDEGGQVSGRVRDILVETLSTLGGQPRDRLWDIVLKRLLTRGQMAEHRFDDILAEIASRSESGRWFLKEEFESLSQNDIRNEEEAGGALDRFSRLRCAGIPVVFAAQIALESPRMADRDVDEDQLTQHVRGLIKSPVEKQKFRLGGRMKGVEFYDCLFFYLTRYLKGRPAGKTPRRNMADFLEEYLVRFRDGDKWLYRPPDENEAASLKKSRQSGLGRRIRQYAAFLRGDGEFPKEKMPDVKTLAAWLKHCANFGLADEGVALYEKGGLMGQTAQLTEDERFDAEDYYAQCRRNASRAEEEADGDEAGERTGEEATEDDE